ncbi:hypothetical protein [Paractinoplanes rishiriensis]|uniref:Lipoprotein n=1 Tax=Paractinoplanes rishiriensis TaxID=1050105 RepID=A0A919MYK8_9ACTN|nr:hypothetical protein [Actinoplanes rishiriensis]GIE97160.1 hypothetical protein Ari01nite_46250 [Actinoplanes rishiriensis]
MKRISGILAATVVLGAAGCAGDAEPVPAVCDSYAAVQNTVDHIRDTNVSENGLTALRPYLNQLRDQLHQLYLDAQAQFASQADVLRTTVDQLAADVRTANEAPNVTNLAAVRSSVAAVRSSAQTLRDAMASTC